MEHYWVFLQRVCSFYVELLLGCALFLHRQGRRKWFVLRLAASAAAGILLMNHLYYILVWGSGSTWLDNLIIYASALVCAGLIARFCCVISWSEACFCAVAGYGAQFTLSVCGEMLWRIFSTDDSVRMLLNFLLMSFVYGGIYLFIGRRLKVGQNFDVNKLHLLALVAGLVLVEIVLCFNFRMRWMSDFNIPSLVSDCVLLLICSVSLLTIQCSLLLQRNLSDELRVLQQMRHMEQEQFEISSDTIDLINRKCHDMRHQIRTIGASANVDPATLHSMEQSIGIYDSLYKTGCQALDVILTEKSLYCQANSIQLNCMADGESLRFIRDEDIYSLFGNILENAIHAVQVLEEDKRVVGLTVRRRGELLSVSSHNCFAGEVVMQDGLPQTTTGDPAEHGFGTKSIAAIVKKYGGTVSFRGEGGIFELNILFSVPSG